MVVIKAPLWEDQELQNYIKAMVKACIPVKIVGLSSTEFEKYQSTYGEKYIVNEG